MLKPLPTVKPSKYAGDLIKFVVGLGGISEMKANRGSDYASTNFYQIRVKPDETEVQPKELLDLIKCRLESKHACALGISCVTINNNSPNSSKFQSVSFEYGGFSYDVVLARGGNSGEKFEKQLLYEMRDHILNGVATQKSRAAFHALCSAAPGLSEDMIADVVERSGSTKRSGDMSPAEAGRIIADIILVMRDDDKKHVSVKNKDGSSVAQFGIARAFRDDLTVDLNSNEWVLFLSPFGLDPQKIEEGLRAAAERTDLLWEDTEVINHRLDADSPVFRLLKKMWGSDYYYLREHKNSFYSILIDDEYLNQKVLHDLRITRISYPCRIRKQISIYLSSTAMDFKIEIRNPRGKGSVKPTQIQMSITKHKK